MMSSIAVPIAGLGPKPVSRDVKTTMIYTRVLNRGGKGVCCPADGLDALGGPGGLVRRRRVGGNNLYRLAKGLGLAHHPFVQAVTTKITGPTHRVLG